jgi:hypothetical protein
MKVLGILILIAGVIFIIPVITIVAWELSVHSVFGIREITWVEAFAFNLLGTVLCRGGDFYNNKNK